MNREEDLDLTQLREEAKQRAIEWIKDKPVEHNSPETGYYELYDLLERRVIPRGGHHAGEGNNKEFHYSVPRDVDRYAILIWAHTHPKVNSRFALRQNAKNRKPSPVDRRNLLPYADLVIKGPDGKTRVYKRRRSKPFRTYPVPK